MADTLDSLEIQIIHTASGAATEILVVASAVKTLADNLSKAVSQLKKFNEQMGKVKGRVPAKFVDKSVRNTTNQNADMITNVDVSAARASGSLGSTASGIRKVGDAAKKANGPLGNFLASLKRIAMYRLLRTIIREITQAFKEGLERAYEFSKGINGEGSRFAKALDSMKVAASGMKSSLGSAFIGLLAIIAPIVNAIISLVTALANALAQLFAVFTGGTWLKATEASGNLVDDMKAGGGAAKEWKNQLLGFDVINKLNDQSGGGGGGGGGTDYSGMFEDTPLTGFFAKLREKFLELKDSLDFEPLIKAWNHLKDAVKGFVDVIEGAFWWAWDNILVPFAHWTIEQVAPRLIEILARAFELLTAALNALKPVFKWVWENLLKPLANWVGDRFIGFLDTVISLFGKLTDWLNGKISFDKFIRGLNAGERMLLAFGTAILAVVVAIKIFKAVTSVFNLFTTILTSMNPYVILAIAIIALLITIGIALYKNWDKIVAGLTAAWDKMKAAAQAVADFFKQWAQDIVVMVELPWKLVFGTVSTIFNGILSVAKAVFSGIVSLAKGAATNIANSFVSAFNGIRSKITDVASTFQSAFSGLKEKVQNIFQGIHDFIKKILDKIKSLFSGSISFPHIKLPHLWVKGSFSLNPPQVPQFGVAYYAAGGFPDAGQLFIANEAGPELVGSMNGRTTVANQEQIIEGIKRGVTEAMMSVMGTQNRQGKNEVVVNINGREFYRATYSDMKAVSKEHGISLVNNSY